MDNSLFTHFNELSDPRLDRKKEHPLINILLIAICGVICGAEDWVAIARFGKLKEAWFSQFLDLSHGIPSHDTFNRVFSLLDQEHFSQCFSEWVSQWANKIKEVIAIDGKAMRGTKNKVHNLGPLYLVNAWCCANNVVLGQVPVDNKSNEITAVPKLLDMLDTSGAIVTRDAMGCQKDIAAKIKEKGGDYIFGLKGNQGNLYDDISLYMSSIERQEVKVDYQHHQTIDGEHGRIETREYWVCDVIDWLPEKSKWDGLNSVAMVKALREINGEQSVEYRFYISSLSIKKYKQFTQAIRQHWQVENSLHWCLDIGFDEDRWKSKIGNCAANMAIINKIALNLLKQEKSAKVGIKNKRLSAGWDENYLLKVLGVV